MSVARNVSSASAVARGLAVTLARDCQSSFRSTPTCSAHARMGGGHSDARLRAEYATQSSRQRRSRLPGRELRHVKLLLGLVERKAVGDQHGFAHSKPLLATDRDHPGVEPPITTTVPPRRTSRVAKRNAAGGAAALPVILAPKRADRPQGQTMPSTSAIPESKAKVRQRAMSIARYVMLYHSELTLGEAETNASYPVLADGRSIDSAATPAHGLATARWHQSVAHAQVAHRGRR